MSNREEQSKYRVGVARDGRYWQPRFARPYMNTTWPIQKAVVTRKQAETICRAFAFGIESAGGEITPGVHEWT